MLRLILLCTLMLQGLWCFAAHAAQSRAVAPLKDSANQEVIRIGLVAPLSGPTRLVGQYMLRGLQLAQDEINASGGIMGKHILLVVADQGANPTKAADAAAMLLAENNLAAIIGTLYSPYCLSIMERTSKAKIPFLAGGTDSAIAEKNNPFTWQVRPTDLYQGPALAQFVTASLKLKNPAIIHSDNKAYEDLATKMRDAFKEKNIALPDANFFPMPENTLDYRPLLKRIHKGGFDGLIALTNQFPAATLCVQTREVGIDPATFPCIGSSVFCSLVCINAAGPVAEGWYSVADWVPGKGNAVATAFEKHYKRKYGSPPDLPAVVAYDSLYLIAKASHEVRSTKAEDINRGLSMVRNYPRALSIFSYGKNHIFPTSLFIARNGPTGATVVSTVVFRNP